MFVGCGTGKTVVGIVAFVVVVVVVDVVVVVVIVVIDWWFGLADLGHGCWW
jgi:hypothetical protein